MRESAISRFGLGLTAFPSAQAFLSAIMSTSLAQASSSAGAPTDASPPAHLIPFARSVLSLLSIWPALQLALHHSPPKAPQTEEGLLNELATELVGAFLDASSSTDGSNAGEPPADEVEDFLLGWVFATLEVRIEDDSEVTVARDLSSIWKEWLLAGGDEARLITEEQGGLVSKVEGMARRRQEKRALMGGKRFYGESRIIGDDGDSASSSDEDDEEEEADEMEVDQPEDRKAQPEIDEDGFTKVVKRGGRR